MAANGPVDAAQEPVLAVPPTFDEKGWMALRPDLRLFAAQERAADRVWRDSSKDWFPTAIMTFEPQALVPASIFSTDRSWRVLLNFTQPLFDGGVRKGLRRFRESEFNTSRLAFTGLQIQARSEVRIAQEALRSNERVLASLRSAAQQADEVLEDHDVCVRGRRDHEPRSDRRAAPGPRRRFGDCIAEDAVTRARLDLLTALGQFPPQP